MAQLSKLMATAPWVKEAGAMTDFIDKALQNTYFAVERLNKEEAMAAFEPVARQLATIMSNAEMKTKMPASYISQREQFNPKQVQSINQELGGHADAMQFLRAMHEDIDVLSRYMAGDVWRAAFQLSQILHDVAMNFADWLAKAKFQ